MRAGTAIVEVTVQVEARRAARRGGNRTNALARARFTHLAGAAGDAAAAAIVCIRLGVDALVVAARGATTALTEAS